MKIVIMLDEPMSDADAHASAIEALLQDPQTHATVVVPNTVPLPDNIPRAKLGDQRARVAIEQLPSGSWMRESLEDDPQRAGGAYEPKRTVFDR